MKTPILSTASLLLFMTGSLLAASQGTNAISPADATSATSAEAPTAAPADAPAAPDAVLARLAARRAADAAGAPDAGVVPSPAPAAGMTVTTATSPAPSAGVTAVAAPPPAPITSAANDSGAPGFTNFQIITRRNIFDPNRRPYVRDAVFAINTNRAPRVEEFEFRSASEKVGMGYTAFFVGSGVPRGGEVHTNDVLNGYKVKKITLHQVTLVDLRTTKEQVMNEQSGLRRQDGGPWNWTIAPTIYSSVPVARAQPQPDFQQPQPFDSGQQFPGRTFTFNPPDDGSGTTDFTGGFGNNPGGRIRNRGNGGQGRRGGGNGGNFGGGGFGNTADDTIAAPAAPVDPAVLARLAARRAAENQ